MKLQTSRRLEQFLQLAGLPEGDVAERMEFSVPPLYIFIELVDEHLLLSVAIDVEPAYQQEALEKMLTRCIPDRTLGAPLRTCLIGHFQILSCTLAENADLHHWLSCYSAMQRLIYSVNRADK